MADAPAATETAPATPEEPPATPPADATPEAPGTDEAEKWKALSRKNERELKKVQAELEKAQQASMSENERAVAEAKAAGRAEAITELNRERVADKVAIAAAGKLADPSDAAAFLGDLDQFIVSGQIDERSISKAIDALVAAKPYLSPQPGSGSGEGGPRGGPAPISPGDDPLLKAILEKTGFKSA